MKNLGTKVLVATLFGVAVYAAILLLSDVRQLQRYLSSYRWWTFGAAIGLAFTNYLLRFCKWELYLRKLGIGAHASGEAHQRLPTGESFAIFVAGFSMSITPGKAGEVFRSVLLLSARGVPVARSASIMIADRLTDLIALIALVAAGSAMFAGYGLLTLAALLLVSAVLLFIVWEALTLRLIAVVEGFARGRALAPRLREAYAALRTVMSPGVLISATLISIAAWALEAFALWVICQGLGAPVSLPLAFFAYATATIAGALAMLPGGLGGTEVVMRQLLMSVGHLSHAAASAGTLLVRLATLWFAVVVGFVALGIFRQRYDRQRGRVDPAVAPPRTT